MKTELAVYREKKKKKHRQAFRNNVDGLRLQRKEHQSLLPRLAVVLVLGRGMKHDRKHYEAEAMNKGVESNSVNYWMDLRTRATAIVFVETYSIMLMISNFFLKYHAYLNNWAFTQTSFLDVKGVCDLCCVQWMIYFSLSKCTCSYWYNLDFKLFSVFLNFIHIY